MYINIYIYIYIYTQQTKANAMKFEQRHPTPPTALGLLSWWQLPMPGNDFSNYVVHLTSDSEGPLYYMVLANAKHRFLRLRRLSAWLSNVPESMNLDKLHRWSILLAGVGHRHRYKRPTAGVAKRTLLLLSHITYECYLYYIWISVVKWDKFVCEGLIAVI